MWTNKPPLNLQKQVLKNQDDIETLQSTHFVEGGFNMTAAIKYKEASLAALQAHTAFNEPIGTFGMVGDVLYVVAKTGKAEQLWKKLGVFPEAGPQGPKGDTGATGPQGAKGDNGLDALVWEGGVFYTRDNVAIGATVNMGPTSSFNRTPVAGDTYNVLLTQRDENDAEIASYFCQLKITQVVGGAFVSEITNFTKTIGKDGATGLPALTYSGTISVDTKPQNGHTFSWAPMFSSDFNRTPVAGDVMNVLVNYESNANSYMCSVEVSEYSFPTLKGTYINVTQATGILGDTIKLEQNQHLKIVNPFNTKYIEIGSNKMDFSKVATRFSVDSLDYDAYAKNNYGPNIKTEDGVVASTGLNLQWLGLNMYYEISDVPTSTKSGTLPDNASWTYLKSHPEQLRILFNKEFYQLTSNDPDTGTLAFSYTSYDGSSIVIKRLTIVISTRVWELTIFHPYSGTATIRAKSENLYDCYSTLPTPLYLNSVSGTINKLKYLPISGWFKHSDNTYCPVIYYRPIGNGQIVYTHPTLGPQTYTADSSKPIYFNIINNA